LVLYVGQRLCGLKLGELATSAGMREYRAASIAIRRFERQLERSSADRKQLKQICEMLNVEGVLPKPKTGGASVLASHEFV
jgi:hypothetical protein